MKKSSYLVMAAALAGMSFGAQAAVQTIVVDAGKLTNIESLLNPSFGIDKFDSTLGALTSVRIDLSTAFSGDLKVENLGGRAATPQFTFNESVKVSSATLGTLITGGNSYSQTLSLARYDGTRDYQGASGVTQKFGVLNSADSISYTDAATLAAFTGAGKLNLDVLGATSVTVLGSGNFGRSVPTNLDVGVTVTYEYTAAPVPEPETYAMLLAGLGLVGAIARRRKSA